MAKFGPVLPGLLAQALERVAGGDPGDPQDEAQATYAGLFEDGWRVIDWDQPARTIYNQVRSWTGFGGVPKGALGEVDGERLLIVRTRLLPSDEDARGIAPPGTILRRDAERMVIQCGDGPIELVTWSRAEADLETVGRGSA
jgi:methionyl-tRNA formyltransferase